MSCVHICSIKTSFSLVNILFFYSKIRISYHPESLLKVAARLGGDEYYRSLLSNIERESSLFQTVCAGLPVALATFSSTSKPDAVVARVGPTLALIRTLIKCLGVSAFNETHLQALWDALVVGRGDRVDGSDSGCCSDSVSTCALRDVAFSLFFDLINHVSNECVEFLFRRLSAVPPAWFATHTRLWNCVWYAFSAINMGSRAILYVHLSSADSATSKRGGFYDGVDDHQRGRADSDSVYFAAPTTLPPPAQPSSVAVAASFESALTSAAASAAALPVLNYSALRVCSTNGLLLGRNAGATWKLSSSSSPNSSSVSSATSSSASGGITVKGVDMLWNLALRHADALPSYVLDNLVSLLISLYTNHATLTTSATSATSASRTSAAAGAGVATHAARMLSLVDRLALTHSFLDIVLAGTGFEPAMFPDRLIAIQGRDRSYQTSFCLDVSILLFIACLGLPCGFSSAFAQKSRQLTRPVPMPPLIQS